MNQTELQDQYQALYEDQEKLRTQLDNLLCRIHRDGGHYLAKHGYEDACASADIKVAEAYGQVSELQEVVDGQTELIKSWRGKAIDLKKEADRIYATLCIHTPAEERCWTRAKILNQCADELAAKQATEKQE